MPDHRATADAWARRILLAILLITALSSAVWGQTSVGTITQAGMKPRAVAVYEAGDKVFVADDTTGNIYTFDGTTLAQLNSVFVGTFVDKMVVHEGTGKLFALIRSPQKVAVLNATNGNFIQYLSGTYSLANLSGFDLDLDPSLGKVYALSFEGLRQINANTLAETTVAGFGGGGEENLAVNRVTHEVFVTRFTPDTLVVVDGNSLATTTFNGTGGSGMAVDTADNKVLITDCATDGSGHPQPCVFDRNSNTSTVLNATNGQDALLAIYNPTGNRFYTSAEVNAISSVIEGATNARFDLPMRSGATALAVRTSTNHVYFVGQKFIGVLDDATQMLEQIPVNNPAGGGVIIKDVAINQTTGRVFAINDTNNLNFVTVIQDTEKLNRWPAFLASKASFAIMFVLDTGSNTVAESWSPDEAFQGHKFVGVRPGGGRIDVPLSGPFGSGLQVYAGSGTQTELTPSGGWSTGGNGPIAVASKPDGTRLYVTNSSSDSVGVVDPSNGSLVTTIAVGDSPWGIAVRSAGDRAYVANNLSNNVSVLDLGTNTVVTTVAIGTSPYGVALTPDGRKLYVANSGAGTVSVMDTTTNTVTTTITVGATPHWLAASPDGKRVYVGNRGGGSVSVIDTSDDSVTTPVTGLTNPEGIGVLPDNSRVLVVNSISGGPSSVTSIDPVSFSTTNLALPSGSDETIGMGIADNSARFVGRVTNSSGGAAISGALVRALQASVEKGTATTNAAGDYSIFNLPAGTYDLEVSATGFTTQNQNAQGVGAGRTEVRDFALVASGPLLPVASFTATPNPCGCNQTVTFDPAASHHNDLQHTIVSYAWNFGDDATQTTFTKVSVTHAYSLFGTYTASLTVTDDFGRQDSTTVNVNVNQGNQAPVASHGGPYIANLGGGISFNGSGSSDPDAACGDSIVSYSWNIAGGTYMLAGATPSLSSAQIDALGTGAYSAVLTVTDEFGAIGTASTTLDIYDNRPFASYTVSPNPCNCNQTVTFDPASSHHGDPRHLIVMYEWTFGDGATSTVFTKTSVTHAYGLFGSYTSSLRVTDDQGKQNTVTVQVSVSLGNAAPVANPGGPYTATLGNALNLSGSGSSDPNAGCGDSIVGYEWDINNDGTWDHSGATPTVTAAEINALGVGVYTVVLRVTDEFGALGTATTSLTINSSPSLWTSLTIPTTETMRSVHFADVNNGWAVGYNGTILHTANGGTSWTTQTSGTTQRFLAVRFLDANNGWAGAGRLVLRTTDGGTTWVDTLADPSALMFRNSLFAVSPTQAWAPNETSGVATHQRWFSRYTVQGGGNVLEEEFDGAVSTNSFFDIFFVDADNGWAVGTVGQIRRISNASSSPSFSSQTSGTTAQLNGIFLLNANTGWVVGNTGTILKTTDGGVNWSALTSGTTTNLKDVHFTNANEGWAVGEGGLILATTDGGATWASQASGVSTTLWSVFFINPGFIAGGDLGGGTNGVLLKTVQADTTSVSFTSGSSNIAENGGTHAVTVTLTTSDGNPSTSQVTVDYSTSDGSAAAGSDYTTSSGTLTFPSGSASGSTQTINVPILDDVFFEGDETFVLTLQNPVGASLGATTTHTVTIQNNEPVTSISVNDVSVTEGNSGTTSLTFTVSLSSASLQTVTVNFLTADLTATVANNDYQAASGTVTFLSGETSKPVTVLVNGDLVNEADETFLVNLTNPINANMADAQGLGTIFNDDSHAQLPLPDFGPATVLGSPGLPLSIAVGDFNRDGELDFAAGNSGVSVYLGDGSGTTFARFDFATVSAPRSIAVGDVNRDGKLDIVAGNYGLPANGITVLLGDGTGTSFARTDVPGTSPEAIAMGDLNNDGKLDVILTNLSPVGLQVMLGDGAGGFAAPVGVGAIGQSRAITLGDLNRDGNLDIVTVDGGNAVSVFLGDGSGTPFTQTNYATGSSGHTFDKSVAVADVNRDGKLDILTANDSSSNVSVLLGDGVGGFGPATDYPETGAHSFGVAVGDLNGDGIPDVAVPNERPTHTVSVLLGNGVGGFGPPADTVTGSFPETITLGDLNGDGRLDIITGGITNIGILLNTTPFSSSGTFPAATGFAVGTGPFSLAAADLNRDGKLDLVSANGTSNDLSILLGNGAGSFGPATSLPAGIATAMAVSGDFNRDGKPDLAAMILNLSPISVFLGDGAGGFGPKTDFQAAPGVRTLAFGDLNRDGKLDMVTASISGSPVVSVRLGDGAGSFGARSDFATGSQPRSIAIGDFNGDAMPDLAVANEVAATVSVFLGDGTGLAFTRTDIAVAQYPVSIAAGDLNGDGNLDLAVAIQHSSKVQILLGDGTGTGFSISEVALSGGPTAIAVEDFNRDGKLDIATVNSSTGDVTVLFGNGSGTTYVRSDFLGGFQPVFDRALVVGDWNRDGKPDLAVTSWETNTAFLLLNSPEFNLMVRQQGVGSGQVSSNPAGIDCGATCSANFDAGLTVTLTATPDPGSSFVSWSGDCVGSDACVVTLDAARNVTAEFAPNQPPVANAGVDQTVQAGALVTLDGSASSDPNGDTLSYAWSQLSGPAVTLSSNTVAQPTFTPTVLGTYVFQLDVDDGNGGASSDTVQITVEDTTPPAVTVLRPNASGEKLFTGTPFTIEWSASDNQALSFFDVFYSTNGGSVYNPTPICSLVSGAARSCVWAAPGPATTSGRIKVTAHDATGNVASDSSNANYSVVSGTGSITVTRPNTLLNWAIGSSQVIKWNHNLSINAFVKIELSRDGGTNWELLSASFKNTGSTASTFSWVVTGPTTTQGRVRVTWLNGPVSDISNVNFNITNPTVTVTQPNTAVSWLIGTLQQIRWNHNAGLGSTYTISVSRDGGGTFPEVLTTSAPATTATTGVYNWTVTGPASTTARVRVTLTSIPASTDMSNVNFTIANPSVTVTQPNTALNWGIGSTQQIKWNHNVGLAATFTIEVSRDGGLNYLETITTTAPASTATTGVYNWTVTGPASTQARVRVTYNGSSIGTDTSNVNFTIANPFITVSAPSSTTANWGYGSVRAQTWATNLGPGDRVNVLLSTDGGVTFPFTLASNVVASAKTATITTPTLGAPTTMARVRVEWVANTTIKGTNPANFKVQPPFVTVTNPNLSTHVWTIGASKTISWTQNLGSLERVMIELSIDGGANYTVLLFASTPSDGSQAVTVQSGWATTQGRVRITWLKDGSITDASNQDFPIQ